MSLLHKIMSVLLVLACLLTGVVSQKGAKKGAPAKKVQPKKAACKKGKKCEDEDDDDEDDEDDEEEEKPKKAEKGKKEAKKAEPKKVAKGKGKK